MRELIGSFTFTEPISEWNKEVETGILSVYKDRYVDGDGMAITIDSNVYGPYAILSVNIPETDLKEGEFVVPVRNMSRLFLGACLESGFFEDTGKKVNYGFVKVDPIWKLKK